jgi:TRAP-type transport system periplasmic protein
MPDELIRYGTIWPARHVLSTPLAELRKGVAAFANLQVLRYRDEARLMDDLMKGAIDIGSTSEIQSAVPEAGLMYLPYLYRDIGHYRRTWTLAASPVAAKIERLVKRRTGLVPLGYSIVGSRDCIFTDGPVTTFGQLKDLSFRVDDAQSSSAMVDAFGAMPKVVNFFQVRTALARGRVEAAENALFNMIALGWVGPAHFVTCTEHRYLTNFELASPRLWARLTRSRRSQLHAAFATYLASFADTSRSARKDSLDLLTRMPGLSVSRISSAEHARFQRAAGPVVDDFAATHRLGKEIDWIRANG